MTSVLTPRVEVGVERRAIKTLARGHAESRPFDRKPFDGRPVRNRPLGRYGEFGDSSPAAHVHTLAERLEQHGPAAQGVLAPQTLRDERRQPAQVPADAPAFIAR